MKRHQEADEPTPEPPRPVPYDIEEAFEQALAPIELPRHTDDDEYDNQPIRKKRRQKTKDESDNSNQAPQQDHNSQPASIFGDAAAVTGNAETVTGGDNASATGNQPETEQPSATGTQPSATGCRSEAQSVARAGGMTDDQYPPESLTERLWPLAPWMQRYVVALMDLGGNMTLACQRTSRSWASVTKYQALVPEFALACQEAAAWATGIVKASLFQAATIGDLEAVYRGPYLVGWKRNKSVKAAELLLQMSGDIQKGGTSVTLRQDLHVEQVQDAEIPRIVGDVVSRLFGGNKGRPVLEAQPVETDQNVSTS